MYCQFSVINNENQNFTGGGSGRNIVDDKSM